MATSGLWDPAPKPFFFSGTHLIRVQVAPHGSTPLWNTREYGVLRYTCECAINAPAHERTGPSLVLNPLQDLLSPVRSCAPQVGVDDCAVNPTRTRPIRSDPRNRHHATLLWDQPSRLDRCPEPRIELLAK